MRVRACVAGLVAAAAVLGGCGEDDFENEARAPVRVALTGVIQDDEVTVSPAKVGAGPVEIRPAVLEIGRKRKNSNNELLLP